MHTICGNNEIGLQDLAAFDRNLTELGVLMYVLGVYQSSPVQQSLSLAYVFNSLGPHLDITGTSGSLLSCSKHLELGVKILSMDAVRGQTPSRFAIIVVTRNQHVHVSTVDQASLSYGNHAGLLPDKVPRLEDPRGVGLD